MSAASESEAEWLRRSSLDLGLALTERDAGLLLRYLGLLERWNAVYSLTSVRDRAAMRVQHLLDCLAIVRPLQLRIAQANASLPQRILDVGSGGGLPGVVLAILLPQWSVVCVDTVGKKAAFVQQVAAELTLSNLQSLHARVEALEAQPFGVLTARAFASLSKLVALGSRHLAPDGFYLAMKGKVPAAELAELEQSQKETEVFHVEQLAVPGLNAERCIVWMRPKAAPAQV